MFELRRRGANKRGKNPKQKLQRKTRQKVSLGMIEKHITSASMKTLGCHFDMLQTFKSSKGITKYKTR